MTCSPVVLGRALLYQTDCIEWLRNREDTSIHAVVTDPPFGLREYNETEKAKLRTGKGGVWRIPPKLGGHERMPLPRFTTLTRREQEEMEVFFLEWALETYRVLVPGGHVFVATNPLVSHLIYGPLMKAGFEKRGEIIRLVQNSAKRDRPPVSFYTPDELVRLSVVTGLSLPELRHPGPNVEALRRLSSRLDWFFKEFLMKEEMTIERDGKVAGELVIKALGKVIAAAGGSGWPDLDAEYDRRRLPRGRVVGTDDDDE